MPLPFLACAGAAGSGAAVGGLSAVATNAVNHEYFDRTGDSCVVCAVGAAGGVAVVVGGAVCCPNTVLHAAEVTNKGVDASMVWLSHCCGSEVTTSDVITTQILGVAACPAGFLAACCLASPVPELSDHFDMAAGVTTAEPAPINGQVDADVGAMKAIPDFEAYARKCVDELGVWDADKLIVDVREGAEQLLEPNQSQYGLTGAEVFCMYLYTWDYILHYTKSPHGPKSRAKWNEVKAEANLKQFYRLQNLQLHASGMPSSPSHRGEACEVGNALRNVVALQMNAIRKLPRYDGKLYRGMPETGVADKYQAGAPVHWCALVSTTTDVKIARKFAKSDGVLFVITLHDPDGKDHAMIDSVSAVGNREKEVLLRPNMKFFVTDNTAEDPSYGGMQTVYLSQMRDDALVRY